MNRQFDYQQELDALHFTQEQKAAIAERAAQAAQAQMAQKKQHRPVWRTAVIAAALAVVLAVGAGASGVLRSAAEVLGPIFGASSAQTEIIDKIGYPVGASDTDNGITITAEAVMGDRYNAAIVYTVCRDDGAALLPDGISAESLLVRGGGTDVQILGGSHGGSWFVDEVPGDDRIQIVQTVSSDQELIGAGATAEFENLYWWDEGKGESVPVLEGHWKFRFDLDYEDSAFTLDGGQTFAQNGMTFTIDEITLSPVAIKVDYTVDQEVEWSNSGSGQMNDEDQTAMERYFENVEILLTKTDGTVVDFSGAGGSVSPQDGTTVCSKGTVFSQIIPVEEMASLSVGGIAFSLED